MAREGDQAASSHAIALVAPGALVSLANFRKPELEIVALYPYRQMLAERFPE
jgi:hypothetical protein